MITISNDGKTYKPSSTRPAMLWEEMMSGFIGSGALEEVKENKETRASAWRDNVFKPDEVPFGEEPKEEPLKLMDSEMKRVCLGESDASILEKLRVHISALREGSISYEDTQFERGMVKSCDIILDLLTTLETKEDRTQQTVDITGLLDLCMNVKPQFTPGQEEVIVPELSEETKKLMCDFADFYCNGLLNRDRRMPEEHITQWIHSQSNKPL